MALRGTREERRHLTAGAAFGEALEYCPPEYITATTAAARYSPKTRARASKAPQRSQAHVAVAQADDYLDQESDENRNGRRGHIGPAQCSHPEKCAARPTQALRPAMRR
jgi:hypothetical protein